MSVVQTAVLTAATFVNVRGRFQVLRYFALDGTGHADHKDQASMIRQYIIRRNANAKDRAHKN